MYFFSGIKILLEFFFELELFTQVAIFDQIYFKNIYGQVPEHVLNYPNSIQEEQLFFQ